MGYETIAWLQGFVANVPGLGRIFVPAKMQHDLIMRTLAAGREWDEHSSAIFAQYVRADDWVLELGAFNGSRTLRLAQLVGPKGLVFCWEPQPQMCQQIYLNLTLNALDNVVVVPSAAGRIHELAPLYCNPNNYGGSSLHCGENTSQMLEKVRVMPIDAMQFDRPITFIKIDVEGAELALLQGAEQLLRRDHPTLFIEIWDDEMRARQHAPSSRQEVFDFLQSCGYDARGALHVRADDYIVRA